MHIAQCTSIRESWEKSATIRETLLHMDVPACLNSDRLVFLPIHTIENAQHKAVAAFGHYYRQQ